METINLKSEISPEQISDLMVTALEGGINYWCGKVEVKIQPVEDWECASDVIGLTNGVLELTDIEDPTEKWELNKKNFLKGLQQAMQDFGFGTIEHMMDNYDADFADYLIQHALFNELVFG